MKKRNALLGCFIAAISLTLSACDFLPENFLNFQKSSSEQSSSRVRPSRNPSSSSSSVHVHEFSEEWTYNNVAHWHGSTCGHSVKKDIGEHEFYSVIVKDPTCSTTGELVEICTICDYQRTIEIPTVDHNWIEYSRIEPTCNESGLSRRYCSKCGVSDEVYLDALGHDFATISYQASTCTENGYTVLECTRCHEIIEYQLPTSDHRWTGYENYYYGYDGAVSYTTDTCIDCGATKIAIKAMDGNYYGTFKTGLAQDYGYVKFKSNGDNISYTFDYPTNAYGTLYQHAIYDQNPGSYDGYSYRSGNSTYEYNFRMTLNDNDIDLNHSSSISYGEFLNNGEEIPGVSYNGYSLAANCLIGEVSLKQGLNTLTYTRTGSYCLWFDYLIFVVQNSDHTHTPTHYWNFDDNGHWHDCEDRDCPVPNARIDYSAHTYGERYSISPVTCHSDGIDREVCSVCGYQHDIIIPATDHVYKSLGSFETVDNSVYLEEYGCEYCDQYALRWSALEYDRNESRYVDDLGSYVRFQSSMVENAGGTPQDGSHIVYKVYSPVAQRNVGLAFYMAQSASSASKVFASTSGNGYIYDQYGNLVPTNTKYGLRVNGTEVYLGEDNYDYVNNSGTNWYNWPVTFNLVAGINTIDIYCLDSNYRARVYNYQITGVTYIEPNHVHTPSNYYEFDSNCHYNPCVNGDGARFNEEPHSFTDYIVIAEPTCAEYGQMVRTCTVCGYEEYTSSSPNGHRYENFYWIQEPTCTQEGIEEAVCSVCGNIEQWTVSPYGHSWDEGVVISASSHTVPGEMLYTCYNCGEQKIESIPADHNWGEPAYVEPVNGGVGYTKRQCLDDNATEIDIKAMDGLPNGDYKTMGTDYIRLSNNGMSISYDFNFDQHAIGKLYIRGSLSAYPTNQTKLFLNSGSSPSGYTFEVTVNGSSVDMSENIDKTFFDLLDNGYVDPSLSSSYSPVANVPIGYVELNPGINNITYYRYGSYNLYMSDIILVVEPTDHVHTPSSNYSSNIDCHWHYCTDPNCPTPNSPINSEYHNYVPVESSQFDCYSENTITYVCSICGFQMNSSTGYADHQYDGQMYWATNSDGLDVAVRHCANCQTIVESMDLLSANISNGSFSGGKLQAGTTLSWKMPAIQTGWVSIYLPCRMSSTSSQQIFDPSLYDLSISGTSYPILMPYGMYTEIGITDYDNRYFKFAEYYVTEQDIANGEIEISFTSNVSSYRLIFDGEIRLEF